MILTPETIVVGSGVDGEETVHEFLHTLSYSPSGLGSSDNSVVRRELEPTLQKQQVSSPNTKSAKQELCIQCPR